MKRIIPDFTKIMSYLLMTTSLLAMILIAPVPSAIAADPIEALIDVNPDNFNLESHGKWATVYIEFADNCPIDIGQIDADTVILNVNGYDISAETKPYGIGDYDLDGIPDLMLKFNRQILQSHMFMGSEELTVSGTADGNDFQGSDMVSVKAKGITATILQTSDMHHHASGYGPYYDYTPDILGDDGVTGGYARLATVIGGIRYQQAMAGVPTMLLDSGDYFMGTTYDLTAADPVALKFFTLMGYDAVTLGKPRIRLVTGRSLYPSECRFGKRFQHTHSGKQHHTGRCSRDRRRRYRISDGNRRYRKQKNHRTGQWY